MSTSRAARIVKALVRVALAIAMVGVGILHFTGPAPFIRIVPAWLPAPAALVAISGVAEIALGLALLVPHETVRKWTGWGLIALYVAVFPANVNMAVNQIQLNEGDALPVWAMWARLPFQVVFMGVAWWVTRPERGVRGGGERRG